jgi:glycosyltransferase involved in cell wall biosynthesis
MTLGNIDISVIVPAFNSTGTISSCLNSIINQKYQAAEIIVIDDGSEDGLGEFLKNNYPKVIYKFIDNSGPSTARNMGIELAKGNYVAFLDSDDLWLENHLKNASDFFLKNKQVLWYCSGYRNLNTNKGSRTNCVYRGKYIEGQVISNYFKAYSEFPGLVWTGGTIIEKDFLLTTGCFNVNFKYGEDLTLWFQLALRQPSLGYNSEVTAVYSRNLSSLTNKIKDYNYINSFNVIKYNYVESLKFESKAKELVLKLWINDLIKNVIIANQKFILKNIQKEFKTLLSFPTSAKIEIGKIIPTSFIKTLRK